MDKTKLHTSYKDADGNRVSSVTTIIGEQLGWNKRALMAWSRREAAAGNDPDKVRDKSADIGTLAHYLIECMLLGTVADVGEFSPNDLAMAQNAYNAFNIWWEKSNLIFFQSELPVVSEQYKYGGTIDMLAKHGDDMYLIDFKTSNGVYPEHIIQVAAYQRAYTEITDEKVEETYILQLSKDSDAFHEHRISDEQLDYGWEVFNHLLMLSRLQKALKV